MRTSYYIYIYSKKIELTKTNFCPGLYFTDYCYMKKAYFVNRNKKAKQEKFWKKYAKVFVKTTHNWSWIFLLLPDQRFCIPLSLLFCLYLSLVLVIYLVSVSKWGGIPHPRWTFPCYPFSPETHTEEKSEPHCKPSL